MNDHQEDKNTMYLTVEDHLSTHASDYASHPKIAPALIQLSDYIVQISAADGIAISNTTGVAEDKQEERVDLENISYKVANALNSYARNTGNRHLEKISKYTLSDFRAMRDSDINTVASLLHGEATPIIALLADDRLTPADLVQLESERTEFLVMLAKPRHAQIEKTVAGSDVDRLMAKTDLLLKDIDGYVETYRFENESLWQEYNLARAIVDSGGGGGTPGGGGSPVVFSGSVPAMNSVDEGPVVYNASTPVILENTGGVNLGFQLILGGFGPPALNVAPASTVNTTLGAMAPNGDTIRINNNDPSLPGSYVITIG